MNRLLSITYILISNALCAWLAAWPMLTFGVNPWTLLVGGNIALPLVLLLRLMVLGPIGAGMGLGRRA